MNSKINIKELAQLAVICAVMFISKEVAAYIPNVHPVMLIIISTTLCFGWKAMFPVVAFSLLEIFIYGLGLWTIMYLYIWPIAVIIVMAFRKVKSYWMWALISGLYGLCFGALCSIPYIFINGLKGAFEYWLVGIPYDLIHGASNFVITALLLPILLPIMQKHKA